MVYGAPVPALSAGITGFVLSQDSSALGGALSCTTDSVTPHAGRHPITCSGLTSGNYAFTYLPGTLTVTPAQLSVTAPSLSMNAGSPVPPLAPTYGGFVNGDTPVALTVAPACTTTATPTSAAGAYPVTCAGAKSNDYTFAYVAGTLTVVTVYKFGGFLQPINDPNLGGRRRACSRPARPSR
jgi:hypothetical protein